MVWQLQEHLFAPEKLLSSINECFRNAGTSCLLLSKLATEPRNPIRSHRNSSSELRKAPNWNPELLFCNESEAADASSWL